VELNVEQAQRRSPPPYTVVSSGAPDLYMGYFEVDYQAVDPEGESLYGQVPMAQQALEDRRTGRAMYPCMHTLLTHAVLGIAHHEGAYLLQHLGPVQFRTFARRPSKL
jgi:hypothetical protein